MATEKVTEVPKLLKDATHRQYLPDIQLGSGGFATCWRADMIDRRNPPESSQCALKAVKSAVPKNLIQRFRLELAIQSKLRHPHIVQLFRAFTFQDITYVALELCPNGSLTDMMRRRKYLTMGEIRRMLIQVCGAVKYLHDRDVVHRDIKAGNIFLDADMNVKLGDFGLAAIMEPSPRSGSADSQAIQHIRRTTFCGTPNYLAPEILSRHEGHGTSVDIWAIGILAYYLAVGRAPFHSKSKDEIYARLKKGEYSWPDLAPAQNEIPSDLRSLVGTLLVEETQRPTCDEIVEHTFLKDGFIPPRLEPLCRTRRPRFARISPIQLGPEQSRTYNELCIASRVGQPWKTKVSAMGDVYQRRHLKSLFLILAKEVTAKEKLEIPLKEGLVYTGELKSRTKPAPSSNPLEPTTHSIPTRTEMRPPPRKSDESQPTGSLSLSSKEYESRASQPVILPGLRPQESVGLETKPVEQRPLMRSKPRRAIPKFEILEDAGDFPPSLPLKDSKDLFKESGQLARLRPLRGRAERGNRVKAGVAAIEKRQLMAE